MIWPATTFTTFGAGCPTGLRKASVVILVEESPGQGLPGKIVEGQSVSCVPTTPIWPAPSAVALPVRTSFLAFGPSVGTVTVSVLKLVGKTASFASRIDAKLLS